MGVTRRRVLDSRLLAMITRVCMFLANKLHANPALRAAFLVIQANRFFAFLARGRTIIAQVRPTHAAIGVVILADRYIFPPLLLAVVTHVGMILANRLLANLASRAAFLADGSMAFHALSRTFFA